ncbi:MAG: VanW family protein [Thermomicrobiales bacterium]
MAAWFRGPLSRDQLARRLRLTAPRLGLAMVGVLLLLAIGLLGFRVAYGDRIYPAVIVGDVSVGGMTPSQAQSAIQARADAINQGTFTFSYEGKTWTPTLAELGGTVDVDSALSEAERVGRSGDATDRLAVTGSLLRDDKMIPLKTSIDQTKLNAWFDKVDSDIGHPAVDADLVVNGGTVTITNDEVGTVVDRAAATKQIMAALQSLGPISVAMPVVADQPKIRASDLQDNYDMLSAAVKAPITANFSGTALTIDPTTLTQYLTVETTLVDGSPHVALDMDRDALATALNDQYSGSVNSSPVDATVAWSDGVGLVATSDSQNGYTLEPDKFADAVVSSFLGSNKSFDLPVAVTKPEIDANNLGALGITTALATGDSDFSNGSEARDTNIYVGIGLLNGTLVRPGGEFSFNGAIGAITADKGYVEAGVIVAERVGRDIGGGICQVSTTTFRAALLAGMPIGEWNPHSYRLKGYEADGWTEGFDASILQEGDDPQYWGDFTFTNNTPGWILVSAWTSYPKAYVRIYGTDDGRTVKISDFTESEPITDNQDVEVVDDTLAAGTIEQSEWPQDGINVGFMRDVYDASGELTEERWFQSDYAGRGNVYRVSPDMEGKSPAGDNSVDGTG